MAKGFITFHLKIKNFLQFTKFNQRNKQSNLMQTKTILMNFFFNTKKKKVKSQS